MEQLLEQGTLKVFRLNEYDWVAAKDLKEALSFYEKETGMDKEEALDNHFFEESKLSTKMLIEDCIDSPANGREIVQEIHGAKYYFATYEEEIEKHVAKWGLTPFIIASTEF
jgi:hypothetical protein